MTTQAIITYIPTDGEKYADIQELPNVPRVGEFINISDHDSQWWQISEVIYTLRQYGHEDGPALSVVACQTTPQLTAIRKKSETQDG